MQTKTLLLTSVALAAALAIGGLALAQTSPGTGMQPGMQGHGMQGMMPGGHGMHGMMHGGQGMHAMMQGGGGQGDGGGHGGRGQRATRGDTGASSLAFQAANEKMHRDMDVTFSGDADVDFVRGMIPHHQGAVDMAKITLGFGKDPEIRKLAETVVKAQETEIAFMRDWLRKRGQ